MIYIYIGIVKNILFKKLLKNWTDRFEVIKGLAVRFGLMVPVIEESVTDPEEQLFIVPSLLPDRHESPLLSSFVTNVDHTFYLLFSTHNSFVSKKKIDILTLSNMRKLGFLPKGLFSRLLAKLFSWCQLTSGDIIYDIIVINHINIQTTHFY